MDAKRPESLEYIDIYTLLVCVFFLYPINVKTKQKIHKICYYCFIKKKMLKI